MKKAMTLLFMMTSPLWGSEKNGIKILNPKKTSGQATYALIKENNGGWCFKVYNQTCTTKDFNSYFQNACKLKVISIIHFDNTTIKELNCPKGIKELRVTHSTIETCSEKFDSETEKLQSLYIENNKIFEQVGQIFEKITTSDGIIIFHNDTITDNNVLIQDANNTNN